MKYAYTYFLTCCVLPFFWDRPTAAHQYQTPADPTEYPDRCDCYAVEPDMECVLWAAANCEFHPAKEETK